MSGLSVLVVDDEPLARRRIVRLLRKLAWIETIEEAGDVDSASARISDTRPDILLLDIQMPGGSGFDLVERWTDALPALVFITAFDHHALRAFQVNAIDYVTKPIEPGRFYQALDRARGAAENRLHADRTAELRETVAALKRALSARPEWSREFWVKYQGEHLRIAPEEVVRFQADRDYVRLHADGTDYLYHDSLTALEQRLDPDDFMRVHRGTIVRRDAINRIKPGPFSSLVLVLRDGSEVRVGRTYAAMVRASLGPSA